MSRVSERFLSRGHAERFDAVVWANDAARTAASTGSDFADGAMFVEEAIARGVLDGGASGLLMMEKRSGTWRFAAMSGEGEGERDVASDSQVALCGECHRDASHDFVFRTTAPASQSSSAAASAAMTAIAPTAVAIPAVKYDARSAGSADLPSSR